MGPCVPLHLFYAHTNLVNGMMFLSNLRMNGVCLFNKGQVFFFFFFFVCYYVSFEMQTRQRMFQSARILISLHVKIPGR